MPPRPWLLPAALALPVLVAPPRLVAAGEDGAPRAPTGKAPCSHGTAGALSELACDLSRTLPGLPAPIALAVVAPTSTSASHFPREAELWARLLRLVAAELGPDVQLWPTVASVAMARAQAGAARSVVVLSPELGSGQLRVAADAYTGVRSFWDRVRAPSPAPLAHAFASRRIDGEIGSLLPPVPLVAAHIDRVPAPTPDVVALACGDADQDGALEILVVGRRKILLGRVRQGRFLPHGEALWSALSTVAPSPLREPVATATLSPDEGFAVGLTDRASALRLSPELVPLSRLEGRIPWAGGCLVRAGQGLAPAPCDVERPLPAASPEARIDAVAGARTVDADGHARMTFAGRTPDGSVSLRDSDGRTARISEVGAALALGDLDLDGTPELVASLNALAPAEDAVVVRSWDRAGTVRERLRVPAPDGVVALATCPPEGGPRPPWVVATTRELWVVR